MGLCDDRQCLYCEARQFCMNFGDEGFFDCDFIISRYEESK
jgi:hypothetical protein